MKGLMDSKRINEVPAIYTERTTNTGQPICEINLTIKSSKSETVFSARTFKYFMTNLLTIDKQIIDIKNINIVNILISKLNVRYAIPAIIKGVVILSLGFLIINCPPKTATTEIRANITPCQPIGIPAFKKLGVSNQTITHVLVNKDAPSNILQANFLLP